MPPFSNQATGYGLETLRGVEENVARQLSPGGLRRQWLRGIGVQVPDGPTAPVSATGNGSQFNRLRPSNLWESFLRGARVLPRSSPESPVSPRTSGVLPGVAPAVPAVPAVPSTTSPSGPTALDQFYADQAAREAELSARRDRDFARQAAINDLYNSARGRSMMTTTNGGFFNRRVDPLTGGLNGMPEDEYQTTMFNRQWNMAANNRADARYAMRGPMGATNRERTVTTIGPEVMGSRAIYNPDTGRASYVTGSSGFIPEFQPIQQFVQSRAREASPDRSGVFLMQGGRVLPNGDVTPANSETMFWDANRGVARIVGNQRVGYGDDGRRQILPRTAEQQAQNQEQVYSGIDRERARLLGLLQARGGSMEGISPSGPGGEYTTSQISQRLRQMRSGGLRGGVLSQLSSRVNGGSSGSGSGGGFDPVAARRTILRNEVAKESAASAGLVDNKGNVRSPELFREFDNLNRSTAASLMQRVQSKAISMEEAIELAKEADATNPQGVVSVQNELQAILNNKKIQDSKKKFGLFGPLGPPTNIVNNPYWGMFGPKF